MSQDWSQPSDRAAAAAAPFSDEQRTWLEDCLRRQLPSSSLSQPATTLVASVATTVVSQSSVAGEWTQCYELFMQCCLLIVVLLLLRCWNCSLDF